MLVLLLTLAEAASPAPPPGGGQTTPSTAADLVPALLAGVAGAGLALAVHRRRTPPPPRLVRLGRGAGFRPFGEGLPGTGDGASLWVTPDPSLVAKSLAARLASRGPVLFLPRPDRRSAAWARFGSGTLPIWMPEEERPSARRALAAAAPLAADGTTVAIVVQGTGAMERVAGGRLTAAVEELLGGSGLPVFVVLGEDEAPPKGKWPVVRVNPAAGGAEGAWEAEGVALTVRDGFLERA